MNYDVVFHLDLADEKILAIALSNILNFYNAPQSKDAKVILLANGPAVNLFLNDKKPADLDKIHDKGCKILLCQNALNKFELKKENLYSQIEIVPAGIVALIELQNNGFAYIKP